MSLEKTYTKAEIMDAHQLEMLENHRNILRFVLAAETTPPTWVGQLDSARNFLSLSCEEQEQLWYECLLSLKLCGMALNNEGVE